MGQSESTANPPKPHEPKRAYNTLDSSSLIHPTSHVVHSKLHDSSNIIDSKVVYSTLTNTIVCCGADVAHCTLTDVRICGGRMKHTTGKASLFKGCNIAFGGFEECELDGLSCQHEKSKGQGQEGVGKWFEGHDPLVALEERAKLREMEEELEREREAQKAASLQGGGSSTVSQAGDGSILAPDSEGDGGRNQDFKAGENEVAIHPVQNVPLQAPPPYEHGEGGSNWVKEKEKRV